MTDFSSTCSCSVGDCNWWFEPQVGRTVRLHEVEFKDMFERADKSFFALIRPFTVVGTYGSIFRDVTCARAVFEREVGIGAPTFVMVISFLAQRYGIEGLDFSYETVTVSEVFTNAYGRSSKVNVSYHFSESNMPPSSFERVNIWVPFISGSTSIGEIVREAARFLTELTGRELDVNGLIEGTISKVQAELNAGVRAGKFDVSSPGPRRLSSVLNRNGCYCFTRCSC